MVQAYVKRRVAVWVSSLLVLPVGTILAGMPLPVGALQSQGAVYMGDEAVPFHSVVYSGDLLKTGEGRATVTLPRGDLLVVERHSTAAFSRSPEGFSVGLERGQLSLASTAQLPIRIHTDGLALTPDGSFASFAEVALRGDGSVLVAVHRGAISVANLRAAPVLVSAGQLLTVSRRLAQGEKSKPIGTGAHGKMTLGEKLRTFRIDGLSHGASVAIVAGVVGGAAATAIIVPLTVGVEEEEVVSPSAP